jgi:hypothetical protein
MDEPIPIPCPPERFLLSDREIVLPVTPERIISVTSGAGYCYVF